MEKEYFCRRLPEQPPKGLISWAKRNLSGDLGGGYTVFRAERIRLAPDLQELMDNQIEGRSVWAAYCTCTACGESYHTRKVPGLNAFYISQGDDGETYPTRMDMELEDYWDIEVAPNDQINCPMCGCNTTVIHARNLRGGRTKQVQVATLHAIDGYAVVVYWLVQNNIQGYQKNGYQNPEQSLGGSLYLHQHIFRDFLTGQWGDAVPAGEAGTFLSRTYSKTLPGQIRNVDLDLTELQVIVFVSEDRNEIINACEALIQHENGPGHVFGLSKGTQPQDVFTCDNSVRVAFEFENRNPEGTASAVESVEFLYKSRNREHTFTWQPDSAFGFRQTAKVVSDEFPLYLNGVPDTVEVTVAAVNGEAYDFEAQKPLRIPAIKYFGYTSADSVVVDFRQDAYGSESSWVFQTEEGETVAEGGPYKDIAISQAPKQHLHAVPVSLGCYRLIARDSRGDGINNGFGEGSFAISDPDGNILVEHDGVFTDSAVVMLRRSDVGNERADRSGLRLQIVPNPSAGPCRLEVEGWEGTDIRLEIFNAQGKLVAVKQESTGSGTLSIPLPAEELQAGTYLVKLSGPRQNGVAKWVVINRN